MNRIMTVAFSIALLFLGLQFTTACSVLPIQPPTTSSPTAAAPAATATVAQATVVPTNTTSPTQAPPTAQPTVRVAGLRVVFQAPDGSVQVLGLSGGSLVLARGASGLSPLSSSQAVNAIGEAIYARSATGSPSPVVTIDSGGLHPVAALKASLSAEAVGGGASGGHLAWGQTVISGTAAITELFLGAPDGSQAKSIVKKSMTSTQPPQAYVPLEFSNDGTRLYYSLEPSGLGGYILFGGASNLTSYSIADAKSTELIKNKQFGSLCIDSVSANDKLIAYHCGDKGIGVYTLATKKSSVITLPAEVKAAKSLGNAQFNPDSTRVAFAAALHNPDAEQGWVLVSSGLTGASKVVAKSAAKDYYEMIAWLSADTLLLQSHNPQPALWTVKTDGTGLQKLSDGQFLSLLPARP